MSKQSNYNGPEYPTEAHGSIPAFHSYEEEASFWDTHSTADFTKETEAVKVQATRGLSENVQMRFLYKLVSSEVAHLDELGQQMQQEGQMYVRYGNRL